MKTTLWLLWLLPIFPTLFRQPTPAVNPVCQSCVSLVDSFKDFLASPTVADLVTKIKSFGCHMLYPDLGCNGMEDLVFRPNYLVSLRTIDSEAICSALKFCFNRFKEDRDEDFSKRVLEDYYSRPIPKRKPSPAPRSGKKVLRLATFGDIHIDFGYEINRTGICTLPTCCRKENAWANGTELAAGPFGFVGICDLPKEVYDSFLDYLQGEVKPDIILYLGDNAARNVWEITRANHMDATKYIAKTIQAKLKRGAKVYPALGNHEGFPYDQFDVSGNTHQWLLDETAELWEPWLNSDALAKFRRSGSYSQLHPGTNLRIISINPFVMLNDNVYLWDDSTDPLDTLAWLESTLSHSELNHESVVILSHVPPYDEPANPHWSERYLVLMQRYVGIIKAQMFAHVHEGYFTVMKGDNGEDAGVGHVNPTLTTSRFLHPTFRVYEMDPDTYELLDYVEHRMNVTESNLKKRAAWRVAHRFTEYYGVKDMSSQSFEQVMRRMQTEDTYRRKILRTRYQDGPLGEEVYNSTKLWENKRCDYEAGSITRMAKCKGLVNATTDVCYDYELEPIMVCKQWRRKLFP